MCLMNRSSALDLNPRLSEGTLAVGSVLFVTSHIVFRFLFCHPVVVLYEISLQETLRA